MTPEAVAATALYDNLSGQHKGAHLLYAAIRHHLGKLGKEAADEVFAQLNLDLQAANAAATSALQANVNYCNPT